MFTAIFTFIVVSIIVILVIFLFSANQFSFIKKFVGISLVLILVLHTPIHFEYGVKVHEELAQMGGQSYFALFFLFPMFWALFGGVFGIIISMILGAIYIDNK